VSEDIVNRVRSTSSGTENRARNEVGDIVFPIDAPAHHGGSPEEITPADAFLAGISACGVLLVERRAGELGLTLERVETTIEARRALADPSWFTKVNIHFEIAGPTQQEALALVQYYEDG